MNPPMDINTVKKRLTRGLHRKWPMTAFWLTVIEKDNGDRDQIRVSWSGNPSVVELRKYCNERLTQLDPKVRLQVQIVTNRSGF